MAPRRGMLTNDYECWLLPLTALRLEKARLRSPINGAEEMETSIQSALAQSARTAFRTHRLGTYVGMYVYGIQP